MRIYFSGIGGAGLGPLAEIAHDTGHFVAGSDMNESLFTEKVINRNIEVNIGPQDGVFLRKLHDETPIDWFVHSSALPEDHPELLLAQELGLKISKRDALLAQIIDEKGLRLIAVAGSHGKTTTTGMLVWAFMKLGIPVSYSIGATVSFGPSGSYSPESNYFIYECDEFDRNFLAFQPYLSVITTVDYDHPDTYPTIDDYNQAFRQFGNQSRHVIGWQSQRGELFADHPSALILEDDSIANIKLPGAHNRRNASLVVEALNILSLNTDNKALEILDSFPGTHRRFEKLSEHLYTDYGHHPIEITATLQMARELSEYVVLIYQPHQNIRQHEVRELYVDTVFADASEVYWMPTYQSRENPELEILTPEQLTEQLSGTQVHIAKLDDELWKAIQEHIKQGHLVLISGAGDIDTWIRGKVA
jgi:UDP-N-acetylmuramate--alanine ligase